jgi:HNH endonuclease
MTSKKRIPKALKDLVWNTYIGVDIGRSACRCCKNNAVTMTSFHCGHVVSEASGGETALYNLRPICASCNLSMGKKDMRSFMRECGFGELLDYAYDMEID